MDGYSKLEDDVTVPYSVALYYNKKKEKDIVHEI
jgi:hypothetical protein